ncbi:glycosyl hydrolase family 8 [Roseococcus sp. DSY-14]|uniref:glycosyl hydrolase family 8 n=1 Tax=Roseococcus sp. DSY-14 TaxID=3369650 RepID=UPI00387ACF5A
MRRRLLLSAPLLGAMAAPPLPAAWAAFRARFVQPDGRVVDTGNGNISHSEGQGWAMLAAARAEDRAAFDALWGWTRRALRRPHDALSAWRFRPGRGVEDMNNATDGDLFIAWALLDGAARWAEPELARQGEAVAQDVLRLLVRPAGEFRVLLPGAHGFEQAAHTVVNPSYYAFPALRALARAVPDPAWLRVAADGVALLREARFGRWGLPPDWLALPRGGRPAPAMGWPARFSYDAVRVPLYLGWAGMGGEPAVTGAARFWADPRHRHLPAWADLATDAISPYPAMAGIAQVAEFASRLQRSEFMHPSMRESGLHYYSSALSLLVRMAQDDLLSV